MEIEKELQADWDQKLNIIFAGPPPDVLLLRDFL